MNFRKITIAICLLFSIFPLYKVEAQSNAGFIPANIWYSKDPFEEGDKIKIYTLIFNPDQRELSGTVAFYDKTTLLGKKSFIVPAKGVKDVSIDWNVDVGSHSIYGKIENAKFLISAGKYENIVLAENQTEESSRTVNKKIIAKSTNEIKEPAQQLQNIENSITENTPEFISKPIVWIADSADKLREAVLLSTQNKRDEVSNEIKSSAKATPSDKKTNTNQILKPWNYIKLFFLSVFASILRNKIAFYAVSAILAFLLLRFLWRRIF